MGIPTCWNPVGNWESNENVIQTLNSLPFDAHLYSTLVIQ